MSTKLQENFPERDAKDFFIFPALDARSQVLSILDSRNGVEKPVFKLAHPDTNSRLILLLLTCAFQTFLLMMSCDMSFAKPTSWFRMVRPLCDCHSFASSPFRHLASRGSPFRGFPSWWAMQFAISLARCLTLQDSAPRYREGSQYEFGRPHDTLSCLFYTALWLGPVSIHCDADITTRGY